MICAEQDQSMVTVVVLTSKGTLLAHGLPAPQPDAALFSALGAAYSGGEAHSESSELMSATCVLTLRHVCLYEPDTNRGMHESLD